MWSERYEGLWGNGGLKQLDYLRVDHFFEVWFSTWIRFCYWQIYKQWTRKYLWVGLNLYRRSTGAWGPSLVHIFSLCLPHLSLRAGVLLSAVQRSHEVKQTEWAPAKSLLGRDFHSWVNQNSQLRDDFPGALIADSYFFHFLPDKASGAVCGFWMQVS